MDTDNVTYDFLSIIHRVEGTVAAAVEFSNKTFDKKKMCMLDIWTICVLAGGKSCGFAAMYLMSRRWEVYSTKIVQFFTCSSNFGLFFTIFGKKKAPAGWEP